MTIDFIVQFFYSKCLVLTYLYSSLNANNSCYCYDAKGSQFSIKGKNSATKISSPSVENGGFLHTYIFHEYFTPIYIFLFQPNVTTAHFIILHCVCLDELCECKAKKGQGEVY